MKKNHISNFLKQYSDDISYMDKHPNEFIGLPTGLTRLDQCLTGLRGGNIILVCGRPAMGKTAFALTVAKNIAQHFKYIKSNEAVLYFNLELSGLVMARRLISMSTNIPTHTLLKPSHDSDICDEVDAAISVLSKLPIYFEPDAYDINDIKKSVTEINKNQKIGFIVVDDLQGIENKRVEDYTDFLKELKSVARKLNVPILVCGQLKRELEERDCKFPMLSDIRGLDKNQGVVDEILFLYRESYYLCNEKPQRKYNELLKNYNRRVSEWQNKCNEVEKICNVIVAKNKNGSARIIKVYFNTNTALFSNLEE